MKQLQLKLVDMLYMPILFMGIIVPFVKEKFIVSSPIHWLILYVMALVLFVLLKTYQFVFEFIYKKSIVENQEILNKWSNEFIKSPKSLRKFSTIIAIAVPCFAAMYAVTWSFGYLMLNICRPIYALFAF